MIGDRLLKALDLRKINQAELARYMDRDPAVINRWVKNHDVPDINSVAHLSEVLKVSSDYLLGLVEEPNGYVTSDNLSELEMKLLASFDAATPMKAMRQFMDLLDEAGLDQASKAKRRPGVQPEKGAKD